MTLEEHFQLYRAAIKEGALEGYEDFAHKTPTKTPQTYPTIYDYIKTLTQAVLGAAQNYDHRAYWEFLHRHQFAMIQLFSKMVEQLLWGYDGIEVKTLMLLIDEYGWDWFKFNQKSMVVKLKSGDTILVIPRYDTRFFDKGAVCLDADEMRILAESSGDLLKVIGIKRQKDDLVKVYEVSESFVSMEPVESFNTGSQIRDWTLPLERAI